jgi:hypothetical protein
MSDNIIVKYSSYTEAQKRATQKYRANNKDKVNEQRKKYYQYRKDSDPNFLQYKRAKAREYYQKKKQAGQELINQIEVLAQNTPEANDNDFTEFQEAVLNQPEPEQIPEPEPESKPEQIDDEQIETVEVPPKKKRAPRKKKVVNV